MFNLTKDERRVILFLASVALTGLAIDAVSRLYGRTNIVPGLCQESAKIDLNTADSQLLQSIPGIGVKLSSRIIAYRSEEGQFNAPEDLKR